MYSKNSKRYNIFHPHYTVIIYLDEITIWLRRVLCWTLISLLIIIVTIYYIIMRLLTYYLITYNLNIDVNTHFIISYYYSYCHISVFYQIYFYLDYSLIIQGYWCTSSNIISVHVSILTLPFIPAFPMNKPLNSSNNIYQKWSL